MDLMFTLIGNVTSCMTYKPKIYVCD